MSRIFEAIRKAEQSRSPRKPRAARINHDKIVADRRRSQRAALSVPVMVYGHVSGSDPFHEDTRTLQVNANGGLFTLRNAVREGQRLLLMNKTTDTEMECTVVYLQPQRHGLMEVAVEFTAPSVDFWPVAFPPDPHTRSGK